MTALRYAYFPGCKIPYHLPQYGAATRAVCDRLDIELVDLEFNCCGYPARHNSFEGSVFAAARNFALAWQSGLDIMTPCKCCYGNMMHAVYWLRQNEQLRRQVGELLLAEGLALPPIDSGQTGDMRISHLLTVLDRDVTADRLRDLVATPHTDLRVAAHYGCHALRPGYVTRFDNPLSPTIFERLVEATGATAVSWELRLECCGNPLWGKNDRMAAKLASKKLDSAARAGADVVCTACTYCQLQFHDYRGALPPAAQAGPPAMLYPQLLGQALGLPSKALGL